MKYINQDEYMQMKTLNNKYISLCKQYGASYDELSNYVASNTYRREYAKGGECIHLGFYSPSFLDMVTAGCSRGRLYKRTPKEKNHSYEYIFDASDNLICVHKMDSEIHEVVSTEFLIYRQDNVLLTQFEYWREKKILTVISECFYEKQKIQRYETALMSCDGAECYEIKVEEREYNDDFMISACVTNFFPNGCQVNKQEFSFA